LTDDVRHDPTGHDEDEALRLQHLADAAALRGDAADDRRCGRCSYYLAPGDTLAYCWHPRLRLLVGATWTCRHHDPLDES
jgi:hypothetical protein